MHVHLDPSDLGTDLNSVPPSFQLDLLDSSHSSPLVRGLRFLTDSVTQSGRLGLREERKSKQKGIGQPKWSEGDEKEGERREQEGGREGGEMKGTRVKKRGKTYSSLQDVTKSLERHHDVHRSVHLG